ncbi:MAG: glycosyltransferase family 2 protein, partial [Phycisphaeraceae bacterium]|nr:glycosyltransferase family 2 protein [Phycisphaeraceae bacterium]
FHAGIRAARGRLIALMDADRQNDPGDLPEMIERLHDSEADLVQGDRSADRRDHLVRRITSRIGRLGRRIFLRDPVRDTGCSLRVMRREVALAIPLVFRGMHRFIPFYAATSGYIVVQHPVHHRPRTAGRAKYGLLNRAIPTTIDLLAACWMRSRWRPSGSRSIDSLPAAELSNDDS